MTSRIGILIVSRSEQVARGAASMVRELFNHQVPCAYCHYNDRPDGRRNTERIQRAIKKMVTDAGLVVCVDFGCVEAAVEAVIETLPSELQDQVRISDGPIIEGAIVAATIAARGAGLEMVLSAADALCVKAPFTSARTEDAASAGLADPAARLKRVSRRVDKILSDGRRSLDG